MIIKNPLGSYSGEWRASYIEATAAEVLAKLGADHVAWILGASCGGAAKAESLAIGQWHVPNLETMSAYERLAVLIRSGEITVANLSS